MSAKQKLKKALNAIDDARSAMRRAQYDAPSGSDHQIRTALRELDDAETYLKRAIREIHDE